MYTYTFLYRDGGNYKYEFEMDSQKELAINSEITYAELGLDQESFHKLIGQPYDADLDHDLVDVIRKSWDGVEATSKEIFAANAKVDPYTNTARLKADTLIEIMHKDLLQMDKEELCRIAAFMYSVKATYTATDNIVFRLPEGESFDQIF